jgi:cysteinyl-tRNA synthetase
MRLYNTLTRSEEAFAPGQGSLVRMYACGLTVYARGHIGNFRYFVCVDLLRRTLRYLKGYELRQVINFTDVDDRTIAASRQAGVDLRMFTDQYIAAFHEDARALNLEPVEEMPRATDDANLAAMADLVRALDQNGHTYRSDGSVYFKISTFPQYGRLARLDHEGLKAGARVDSDNYDKESARDFVLWKGARPGEPQWDIVDPPGRPGWHLECSAMARRLLGEEPLDIHAGGIDLVFPHHENEMAQSEGASQKPLSRFWFHVEHLLVDDQKMSKSLGNTYTVPEVLEKGIRPSALRYLLLSGHYRKTLNFTWASLAQAEESLRRLTDFLARVDGVAAPGGHPEVAARVAEARRAFSEAMLADLNTAEALAAIFNLVRSLNAAIDADQLGRDDVAAIREAFEEFDLVLGVLSLRRAEDAKPPVPADEIERALADRKAAKARRDFTTADRIRDDLNARGILLEDSPSGTRWKRK